MSKFQAFTFKLLPLAMALLVFVGTRMAEERFFPVVKDFHVTRMEVVGQSLVMAGYMRKARDCRYIGISTVGRTSGGIETDLKLKFIDNVDLPRPDNASRPTGSQDWGPWMITVPLNPRVNVIEIDAFHDCHIAWATKTRLVAVPMINESSEEPKP